jgi:multiple sugar transport system ATP-binding protein
MATLTIKGISKSFGATTVLHNINLDLADGEFLVLVGPSGCGKSTLMNIVAGLEEPSTGSLHLGARDITGEAPDTRDIAMVFQSYALYPNMTVAQNIAFPLEMRKVPVAQRKVAVDEVATLLQIGHLLERKPRQLSGGQRQRVAIGRALARRPSLFLFDEPLSNLDAKLRVDMRAELKKLHMATGVTTIYVTHDQVEAMTLGTRIAVLKDGQIQQLATPMELYERPANTFVAEFIGSPAINWSESQVGAEGQIYLGQDNSGLVLPALAGRLVRVGIRPEDMVIHDAGMLQATVTLVEPTGAESYVLVRSAMGECTLRMAGAASYVPGDTLRMAVASHKIHVFDASNGERLN